MNTIRRDVFSLNLHFVMFDLFDFSRGQDVGASRDSGTMVPRGTWRKLGHDEFWGKEWMAVLDLFCFAELKSGFLNSCQRFLALRLIFDEEELHHIFFFFDLRLTLELVRRWEIVGKNGRNCSGLGRCLCDTSERCGKRSPSAVSMPSRCCRRCFGFGLWLVVQGSNQRFHIQHV